jgi:hypothetical protein
MLPRDTSASFLFLDSFNIAISEPNRIVNIIRVIVACMLMNRKEISRHRPVSSRRSSEARCCPLTLFKYLFPFLCGNNWTVASNLRFQRLKLVQFSSQLTRNQAKCPVRKKIIVFHRLFLERRRLWLKQCCRLLCRGP